MAKSKIGIVSLGCPRNLVDSENLLGRLDSKGYPIVEIEKADIAIVNTCAFIEDAKRESIDTILDLIELKKEGRLKKIIVYGCLSQRYKAKLSQELPEVDAFVGRIALNHDRKSYSLTPSHYAYLKICEGCVNKCSYCIIPKIKKGFESLDRGSVLQKVKDWNRQKLSEINIIGQDITGYGRDLTLKPELTDLLKEIIKEAKNIGWIRLLYLYPGRVNDDLLRLISDSPKICKYIDLPLQHINDRLLKLMNRNTAKKEILRLIEKIRKTIPQAALRTSLIVGFPSESEKEFSELLDFVKEIKFERLGTFLYSREENTRAFSFKGQIPLAAQQERFREIMSAQKDISESLNQKFLGQSLEVLIDESQKDYYLARSQYDAPEVDGSVYVRAEKKLKPGDFVKVEITATQEYDLIGELKK